MSQNTMLMLVAGAAVSISGMAMASETLNRDEVRAIVREVLADAETRTSLLQGGSAGYNNGFVLGDGKDNTLRINAFTQWRYNLNFRSKSATPGAGPGGLDGRNNVESGFTNRRTAVALSGTAVNENIGYGIRFISAADAGAWAMDDAFITYKMGGGWNLKVGQFKAPLLKEELNSDITTMAADRGVVNAFFTQGRTQGLQVSYEQDQWAFMVSLNDGLRAANTAYNSPLESSYALTGRGEFRFAGTAEQLSDYTSKPGEEFAAGLGAAIHWQQASQNPANTFGRDVLVYTIDGQIETNGLSLFAAFVGSYTNNNNVGGGDFSANSFGLVVQGAWRFDAKNEVFVRYDGLYLDSKTPAVLTNVAAARMDRKNFNFLTFGYNHYLFGSNNAKFTLDCIIALNRTNADATSTGFGLLGGGVGNVAAVLNAGGAPLVNGNGLLGSSKAGEVLVRGQFQLAF
jgi:hypothetical protein